MNTRPLLSLSLQAVLFSSLHAGPVNWDGGGNTNDFNDEDNWSGNSLPDDKDEAIFNNFVVSPVLSQTIEIKHLEIKGTSTVTLNTGTFTLKVKNDKDSVKVSSNSSLTFSGNLLATGKKLDLKIDGNAAFGGSIDGDGEKIEIDGNGITTFSSTTVSNFDSLTVKKNAELALDGSIINGAVKVKGGADSAWKCASQLLKKMADGVRLSRHLRGLVFSFDSTSRI